MKFNENAIVHPSKNTDSNIIMNNIVDNLPNLDYEIESDNSGTNCTIYCFDKNTFKKLKKACSEFGKNCIQYEDEENFTFKILYALIDDNSILPVMLMKNLKKFIKESREKFSVYDFIDYMIKEKSIDDIMDYIIFDITQEEFDNALKDMGYDFKIVKKENPHDSIDGVKYYIYQYKIGDEIYRVWVDEKNFVLDTCLKY